MKQKTSGGPAELVESPPAALFGASRLNATVLVTHSLMRAAAALCGHDTSGQVTSVPLALCTAVDTARTSATLSMLDAVHSQKDRMQVSESARPLASTASEALPDLGRKLPPLHRRLHTRPQFRGDPTQTA